MADTKPEALLPCPFCNEGPEGVFAERGDDHVWMVRCCKCNAQHTHATLADARLAWNTRAALTPEANSGEDVALVDELIDTCECTHPACEAKHAKARAAVLAAMTRDQWQDINTAPIDGTAVLLWDGERVWLAEWRSYEIHYPNCEPQFDWCLPGSDQDEQGGCATVRAPTHWQPLPTAPEAPR